MTEPEAPRPDLSVEDFLYDGLWEHDWARYDLPEALLDVDETEISAFVADTDAMLNNAGTLPDSAVLEKEEKR